jgi:signal transduction histidine kinase
MFSRKKMNLSLRNQISLWIGLTTLVLILVTVLIVQEITIYSLEESLDESLQKRGHMVASVISSDITTDEESYVQVIGDLARQELSFASSPVRIISPDGTPILELGQIDNATGRQLDTALQQPDVTAGYFNNVLSNENGHLRTYSVAVFHPRTHSLLAYVQVLESTSQIESVKQGLWRNGIIIGLCGSLLAIIIGQFLIRRGFRPLHDIVEAIDKTDYNHLKSDMKKDVNSVELQQLANSLSAMWSRLDTAVSERDKVIGSMSHDLRTPLTALQGQLEVLLVEPSLSAENRDSVQRMLNETQRLTRLVKNMLLNVQLGANPTLIVEDVNLREILDETIGDIWALARGVKLKISAPKDVIVGGGRDLLKQMLINITDNAIKFTPQDGEVELALTTDDKCATLRVSDTGCGISPEELPHVTEAFYRIGSSCKSNGEGARLGLAIVKQIVDIHGGRLEIKNRVNYGTTVTIQLPLK